MTQKPRKRFWEGAVGITLTPRQQRSGEYFWTFEFVRAFKRQGSEKWEYTQSYSYRDAEALGQIMTKAITFMEQNRPGQFVEQWETNTILEGNNLPPVEAVATA